MTDDRRVGQAELVRVVQRIDGRTARMEAALFEERGLITRVVVLEQRIKDDSEERKINRIMTAVATLVGSTVGSIAAIFSLHK